MAPAEMNQCWIYDEFKDCTDLQDALKPLITQPT